MANAADRPGGIERQPWADARPTDGDLTAKARIRNAALDLFAQRGEDGTTMRAVAARAGVTVGLIVHHYGHKEALREAVEADIVARFADAIESVPLRGKASEVVAARDQAVAGMLAASPAVVDYLRRVILHPQRERRDLVSKLSQLAAEQITELRALGLASNRQTLGRQVVGLMVRQLGELFLQPLVDRITDEFDPAGSGAGDGSTRAGPDGARPRLVVTLKSPS
ncbi:MAG: TetR/AcrR family transcriptional regulator [Actinomycetia bacterium]|nr:TetR/AcrR family transcriptional regulator [Actinomycetes bacterium]